MGEGVLARRAPAHERVEAAEVLRRHSDALLSAWLEKIRLLARERGAEHVVSSPVLRQDATEFLDLMLARLEGVRSEGDVVSFYHLILDGRRYDVRLADLTYVLLEFKAAAKRVLFTRIEDELKAFRVSRQMEDAVDGILRKSAELYELTSEADYKTAQQRLQEIFAAWELEEALTDAQTTAEVFNRVRPVLERHWPLAGLRVRFYVPESEPTSELSAGESLTVPHVEAPRQYLTEEEQTAGAGIELTELVRRRRDMFFCADTATDDRLIDAERLVQSGARSLAGCPLATRDRVVGVLLLYGSQKGVFEEADRRRLNDISGVLALAMDRVARLEMSHREMSEAEVISRIGRALLELPSRQALLEGVAEALRSFRDYFDVSLFRVDRESESCVLVAEAGRERSYRPADYRQAIGQGFIGACAQTGETIRAWDLEDDSRRLVAFEEEYLVCSELSVPIKRAQDVLGVIHVLSDRTEDFPEADIAALENVAPHIGVALQNASMIDQRRRDRFQLERAHRQLANIIRSTAVGITSSDPSGLYTHWSPSCEEMLGYTAEEVVGHKTSADFAAEPYDLQESLQRCVREGRTTTERSVLRKDGTSRVIRETRVPLEDEQGHHIGFTSYLVDVTEQKHAEERLRRERDTLDLVVRAMGAGLAMFDHQLRLQWANDTLMEWFNFGPEDLGKGCQDVYLCGRRENETCPTLLAALSGQPRSRVHEYTDEAGVWRCFQQVFTPIEHGDNRLIALTFDITEQRRQTEQLRLITKLTEKIETSLDLERVMHVVLTCVTAGHAIGFNRAFLWLLNEEETVLEGKMAVGPVSSSDAHRIWDDLDQKDQTIDELLDSAVFSDSDRRLTRMVSDMAIPMSQAENTLASTLRSHTSAHVGDARSDPNMDAEMVQRLNLAEFACVPLAVRDEPIGVMLADNKYSGLPIDQYQVELLEMFARQASLAISNARAYERIRQQLEELETTRDKLIEAERMASVGRMASHLAHEIRNPLTAIGGFARSIAREHKAESRTHRNAEIIYEEVCRLERTLVNVLDYTRPLRPEKQPVQINEIVRETIGQFDVQFQETEVELQMSLEEDLPEVMADGQMVKQVIINLVKNGIEAMEETAGGRLTVSTGRTGDGQVHIRVRDTGVGMTPDVLDELFSPFFTTKIGGIGLGLSVSARIVRQHGGSIEVESEPGEGSEFTVRLAVGKPQHAGEQSHAPRQ